MSHSQFLASLQEASTSQEQAAVLAEAIFDSLPLKQATAARRCGLLRWFTPTMINALLGNETYDLNSDNEIKSILELPFVEEVPLGYTFHASTREGLLEKYKQEKPEEIITAHRYVLPELLDHWENDRVVQFALFALGITGQVQEFQNRLDDLLTRFGRQGKFEHIFQTFETLKEVDTLSLSEAIDLSADQRLLRAMWYFGQTEMDASLSDINLALELKPNSIEALQLRALINAATGKFEAALEDAEQIIKIEPNADAFRHRAKIYQFQNKPKRALLDYNRAIKIDPNNGILFIERGTIYELLERPENALYDYTRASKISPENPQIYITRAMIHLSKQDYDRFEADIDRLLSLTNMSDDEQGQTLIFRAIIHRSNRDWEKAFTDINQSMILVPNNSEAFFQRGSTHFKMKNYTEALRDFNTAIKLKPDNSSAYSLLFETYLTLNEYNLAVKVYNKTRNIGGFDAKFYTKLAGTAAIKLSKFDLAVKICNQVLEDDPDNDDAIDHLGYVNLIKDDLPQARSLFRRSLEINPDSLVANIYLGITEWKLGNVTKAVSIFSKVLRSITPRRYNNNIIPKFIYPFWGWLNIVTGQRSIGLSKIKEFLEDEGNESSLYFLLRTSEILLTSTILPPPEIEIVRMMAAKSIEDFVSPW